MVLVSAVMGQYNKIGSLTFRETPPIICAILQFLLTSFDSWIQVMKTEVSFLGVCCLDTSPQDSPVGRVKKQM